MPRPAELLQMGKAENTDAEVSRPRGKWSRPRATRPHIQGQNIGMVGTESSLCCEPYEFARRRGPL